MTRRPTQHPLVAAYLAELDRLLQGADPVVRAETLAGVSEHIEASLADPEATDVRVQTVLAELGPPEAVADEAYDGHPPAATAEPVHLQDRSWLPAVVPLLQVVGLLLVAGVFAVTSAVMQTTVSSGSDGAFAQPTYREFTGTLALTVPAFLATIWLWAPISVLTVVTGLWTRWEKAAQVAFLPTVALLFGGLPELGYLIASFDGVIVGAWASLVIATVGGGFQLWVLTRRALARAAPRTGRSGTAAAD